MSFSFAGNMFWVSPSPLEENRSTGVIEEPTGLWESSVLRCRLFSGEYPVGVPSDGDPRFTSPEDGESSIPPSGSCSGGSGIVHVGEVAEVEDIKGMDGWMAWKHETTGSL